MPGVNPEPPDIDRWFPKRGPCLVCGTPGLDQRHRRIDAIADAVAAGEGEEDVAADMGVSVEAVEAAVAWVAWEKTQRGRDWPDRGAAENGP